MPSTADSPTPSDLSPLSGLSVLVVDDTPDALDLLTTLLTLYGASVVAASSAHEALEAIGLRPPEVMVSDIGMPGMDGYELIRTVRERGVQMPAVALTGFAADRDRLEALTAGYQEHMAKPVEPDALVAILIGLWRRRSQ